MTYQPQMKPLVQTPDRKEPDALQKVVPLPDSSQTQEPNREGSQASIEAATPRTVTEIWAGKWLQLCRKHDIDPVLPVDEVDEQLLDRWKDA